VGTGSTATFGNVNASSIGSISLSAVGGTGAELTVGTMTAAQTIGAMELAGTDGASATFGAIGAASAIGAIAVSGALDVTFGTITTTTLGEVNATNLGVSGAFTIDLSGVTNAVEVKLGAGTNTIISGIGNDVITLRAGTTGNDVVRFTNSGQGTDNIIGFGAGTTGNDQIEIVGSGDIVVIGGSGEVSTADRAVDLLTVTAGLAGTAALAATDNVVIMGSAFASTAGLLAAIASGGTQEIAFDGGTAAADAGNLVVTWSDGTDTYVSLVAVDAGASGISADAAVSTLAILSGVTPSALVAANFDFV